jgi:hypothetical protein
MTDVKRYTLHDMDGMMGFDEAVEDAGGYWVDYDDYATLQAERDELKKGVQSICDTYCEWDATSTSRTGSDLAYQIYSQAANLISKGDK